ncbi:MAG: J domain-containing protein [Bacteroidota bacterium]|nr:J domain-containing protein [Bacteroidota bacterium]
MKNYYTCLGIPENSSIEQINEAYKKLAQKYHPDKNDNDAYFNTLFKDINDAKQILTDAEKKSEYDLALVNYSDAYDLFNNQRLEDEFNRKQRRTQLEKGADRKRSLFMFFGVIVFLCTAVFLWAEINNENIFSNDKSKKSFAIKESLAEAPLAAQYDNPTTKSKEVFENDKKVKASSIETNTIKRSKHITEKTRPTSAWRDFTYQELLDILQLISTVKLRNNFTSNCITIKKAKNSNVDSNFKIATFLQKHGFIISGRETTSTVLHEYKVDFNGVCLNLTIGTN